MQSFGYSTSIEVRLNETCRKYAIEEFESLLAEGRIPDGSEYKGPSQSNWNPVAEYTSHDKSAFARKFVTLCITIPLTLYVLYISIAAIIAMQIPVSRSMGIWLTGIDALIAGLWYCSFTPILSYIAYIQYSGRWKLVLEKPHKLFILSNLAVILILGGLTFFRSNALIDEYIEHYETGLIGPKNPD